MSQEYEDRINRLENGFNKLKNEFEGLRKTIQDFMVEVRKTLTEVENPFNILRYITDEAELENLRKRITSSRAVEHIVEKGAPKIDEAKVSEEGVPEEGERAFQPPVERPIETEDAEKVIEEAPRPGIGEIPPKFRDAIKMLLWAVNMSAMGFNSEDISRVANFLEYFGLIPRGGAEALNKIAPVVLKTTKENMNDELINNLLFFKLNQGGDEDYVFVLAQLMQIMKRMGSGLR